MTPRSAAEPFDVIVIGSGIGGLACACALSRSGYKVLVLEQHFVAGGLTQTFSRKGFTWDVGLHYLGEMQEGGASRRVIDWLSGGAIHFAPVGSVYDVAHFPGGFAFQFARPEAALRLDLQERFPGSRAELDHYFAAVKNAVRASRTLFAQRAMPPLLSTLYGLWRGADIKQWWGRTTESVLRELISDSRLRAVLAAQRGDYGPDPRASSFGAHSMIARHYFNGAYYPVGGGSTFADALIPVIKQGGGEVRTRARVSRILVEDDAVAGVRCEDGNELRCRRVCSDVGVRHTVMNLLPPEQRGSDWGRQIDGLEPSTCHVALYLGLQGDIRARGATSSNHWFYETWDLADSTWRGPQVQPTPPGMFVSFPSLKDDSPATAGGDRHTAEVVVFTDWELFRGWENSRIGRRPADYRQFKDLIEQCLIEQFARYFPALAPLVTYRELSTPLSTVAFTGAEHGAIYGLESSPRRFLSPSLRAKTPVPGLYLAGQDVTSGGIGGAMMGGVLAAAAIEPRLITHLN